MTTDARSRLGIIERDECLRLLAGDEIGRVDPWAGGDKAHWMRLVPDRVTGRRIREGAAS